jgi:hypothetical protein
VTKIGELGTTQAATSNRRTQRSAPRHEGVEGSEGRAKPFLTAARDERGFSEPKLTNCMELGISTPLIRNPAIGHISNS